MSTNPETIRRRNERLGEKMQQNIKKEQNVRCVLTEKMNAKMNTETASSTRENDNVLIQVSVTTISEHFKIKYNSCSTCNERIQCNCKFVNFIVNFVTYLGIA